MDIVSQIVGGQVAQIMVRQKSGARLELGELLVAEEPDGIIILQVFDLAYASQMQPEALQWAAGLSLEEVASEEFMDAHLRNYVVANLKAVAHVKKERAFTPKTLPAFFSRLRRLEEKDLAFLEAPKKPLYAGQIRCGTRVLDFDLNLDAEQVLPTHVLIAAGTGKGKSSYTKMMLYKQLDSDYCGFLVLDPHNEYHAALESHPKSPDRLKAYSPKPARGAFTLKINYESIKPWHLSGIVPFSEAQNDTLWTYYRRFRSRWINAILTDERDEELAEWYERGRLKDGTLSVLQRKLSLALDDSVFSPEGGQTTVDDIVNALDAGKTVVVDTSCVSSETELLVGSILASDMFERAKRQKTRMKSIVIEEAPRVLKEGSSNVFSSIAREGRKFGVGLVAITQLASLIPREVLANMNTKIILGNEMRAEREALIGSAAQDLSDDSKTIAGLDKGEAIISSVYTKFALPVQFPKFEDVAAKNDSLSPKRAFT